MPEDSLNVALALISFYAALTCFGMVFGRRGNHEWRATKSQRDLANRVYREYGSWSAVEKAARRDSNGNLIIRLPKNPSE